MNDYIFYLSEYNWEKGVLLSEGKKNFKIQTIGSSFGDVSRQIRVTKEKCARPNETVCVVWETWRGKNGRGGYRVERELYPHHRVSANQISRQFYGNGRVDETSYGIEK